MSLPATTETPAREDATRGKPTPPPYVKKLICPPLIYGGRRKVEYTFKQLWGTGTGDLL